MGRPSLGKVFHGRIFADATGWVLASPALTPPGGLRGRLPDGILRAIADGFSLPPVGDHRQLELELPV
jgi:hypothetical protein